MVERLFIEIGGILRQTLIAFEIGIVQPGLGSAAMREDRMELEKAPAVIVADLCHAAARLGDRAAELGGESKAGKMSRTGCGRRARQAPRRASMQGSGIGGSQCSLFLGGQ